MYLLLLSLLFLSNILLCFSIEFFSYLVNPEIISTSIEKWDVCLSIALTLLDQFNWNIVHQIMANVPRSNIGLL